MYVVLVINCPNDSIQDLNDRTQSPTKVNTALNGSITLLEAIEAGTKSGSVQVTTRDTDPAVATHGSGSQQNTYSKL